MTSATEEDHNWWALGVWEYSEHKSSPEQHMLFDIAIGPASSEEIVIENVPLSYASTYDMLIDQVMFFELYIPSGTRIAVRAQNSETLSLLRELYFAMYGV